MEPPVTKKLLLDAVIPLPEEQESGRAPQEKVGAVQRRKQAPPESFSLRPRTDHFTSAYSSPFAILDWARRQPMVEPTGFGTFKKDIIEDAPPVDFAKLGSPLAKDTFLEPGKELLVRRPKKLNPWQQGYADFDAWMWEHAQSNTILFEPWVGLGLSIAELDYPFFVPSPLEHLGWSMAVSPSLLRGAFFGSSGGFLATESLQGSGTLHEEPLIAGFRKGVDFVRTQDPRVWNTAWAGGLFQASPGEPYYIYGQSLTLGVGSLRFSYEYKETIGLPEVDPYGGSLVRYPVYLGEGDKWLRPNYPYDYGSIYESRGFSFHIGDYIGPKLLLGGEFSHTDWRRRPVFEYLRGPDGGPVKPAFPFKWDFSHTF